MPDLIIEPELGDDIHDCFANAFKAMCLNNTYRTASFNHNGLKITISRSKKMNNIKEFIEAGLTENIHQPKEIYNGAFTSGALGFIPHNSTSRYAGWIFWKHPDGQWVTIAKIPETLPTNARVEIKALYEAAEKMAEALEGVMRSSINPQTHANPSLSDINKYREATINAKEVLAQYYTLIESAQEK